MIGSISFTKELASNETRTFLSSKDFTSNFIASLSCIASPIPIVVESISTGTCPNILFTVPRVSFESAIGMTIKSGEIDRVENALIFGTHVYTQDHFQNVMQQVMRVQAHHDKYNFHLPPRLFHYLLSENHSSRDGMNFSTISFVNLITTN